MNDIDVELDTIEELVSDIEFSLTNGHEYDIRNIAITIRETIQRIRDSL